MPGSLTVINGQTVIKAGENTTLAQQARTLAESASATAIAARDELVAREQYSVFDNLWDDPEFRDAGATIAWIARTFNVVEIDGIKALQTEASASGTKNAAWDIYLTDFPFDTFSVGVTVLRKTAKTGTYDLTNSLHLRLAAFDGTGTLITGAFPDDQDKSDYDDPADTRLRRYLNAPAIDKPTRYTFDDITVPATAARIRIEIYATNTDEVAEMSYFTFRAGGSPQYTSPYEKADIAQLQVDVDALEAASISYSGLIAQQSETVPAGMSWPAEYDPTITIGHLPDGKPFGSCGLDPATLFPDTSGWQNIYVDAATGNDTTGDGTSGTPYKSIARAIKAMNDSAAPANIFVKSGLYNGLLNFTAPYHADGTLQNLTFGQDVRFVATDGVVTSIVARGPTWSADGTYAHVYKTSASHSGALRAFDLVNRNRENGSYREFKQVATLALCAITPDSWYTDGSSVWVFRSDGVVPSTTNTRVLNDAANFRYSSGATPVNIMLDVADGRCGWDFEGGSRGSSANTGSIPPGGPIDLELTSNQSANPYKVAIFKKCKARYSSVSGRLEHGLVSTNWHGLILALDCDTSFNACDGFHLGMLATGATNSSHLITVNCTSQGFGLTDATSANAWSMHETCKGIDIAGDYVGGPGITVNNVGTSKNLLVGTRIKGALGDYFTGLNSKPILVSIGPSAEMWIARGQLVPSAAGDQIIRAQGTLHLRDTPVIGDDTTYIDGGSVGTY